ncbi:Kinetochore-associated protein 1 [Nymphon striatum]|nr:Kinetochore-associated protein 1 [Nymphon striatum]
MGGNYAEKMWNKISIGFDGETANFGPRQEYEGKNALYEVQTLVTIATSNKEDISKNPKIYSSSSSKYVTTAVDNHLSIFSEECQELIFNLSFESDVNCFAWDKESLILLVGENNGQLHMLYAPLMKVIVSMPLSNGEQSNPISFHVIKFLCSDKSAIQHGDFATVSQGILAVVCLKVFNVIKIWKRKKILDFMLQETYDGERVVGLNLALIVNADDVQYFELHSFPKSELLYSLVISPFSYLVQSSSHNDEIYIIEGVSSDDSEFIDSLRIRTITEALPECRLMQLLHKRKFTEAEDFAQTFSLDLQMIYKARINYLLESLSPWRIDSLQMDEVNDFHNQMMSCLGKITDINFIVESCIRTCLSTIDETRSVLVYAQQVLKKDANKLIDNDSTAFNIMKLTTKVNDMLQRLETFDQAFGETQFSKLWNHFCTCNLKDEMLEWLRRSELCIAFIIWDRHKGEFISSYEEVVDELLSSLPETISIMQLIPWLKQSLFPGVLQLCPASLKKVVSEENCNIPQLLQLISDLKELLHLKTTFNCKLTLSEFCESDKSLVVFSILDSLPKVEDIPALISTVLAQFTRKRGLSMDKIVQSYIMNLLNISTHNWWHWEESPWQATVLAIIECIRCIDTKMDCVLEVAKQASVPWSKPITHLVEKTLQIKHQSNLFLKEQQRLVGLKTILVKYGLHRYPIGDKSKAERLIRYILSQDRDSIISDAIEVINSYDHLSLIDVYNFRIRYIILNSNICELSSFLTKIPAELQEECCLRLLNFTVVLLEEDASFNHKFNRNNEAIKFSEATLFVCRSMKQRLNLKMYNQILLDLEKIYHLQKEYGIFISIENLQDKQRVVDLLDKSLVEFINSQFNQKAKYDKDHKTSSSISEKMTYFKFFRLVRLLDFSREESICRMIKMFADRKDFKSVIEMCGYLCLENTMSENSAKIVFETLHNLCNSYASELSCETNFSPLFAELMSSVVTSCSKDLLVHSIEQSRWSAFALLLHCQSNKWESPLNQKILGNDSYHEWTFSSIHKDIALRMKLSEVLPSLFEIMNMCCMTVSENGMNVKELILKLESTTLKLVKYLSKKSQDVFVFTALMSVFNFILNMISDHVSTMNSEDQQQCIAHYKAMQNHRNQSEMLLLKKLFSVKEPDQGLVIGILLGMARKTALSTIKFVSNQTGSDYSKQKTIASFGVQMCKVMELPSEILQQFISLHNRAEWGEKLSKLQLSFTEAFATNQQNDLRKALSDLVSHPQADVDLIVEFCDVFEFDADEALVNYLESILISLNADTSISVIERILHKANNLDISKINTERLLQLYQDILDKTNSYSYEILQFTLQKVISLSDEPEVIKTSEKGLKLIEVLNIYDRVSQPTNEELDNWSKHQSSISDIPKIAFKRLPFHILNSKDPWKVISEELNLKTIDLWLEIAVILKIAEEKNYLILFQMKTGGFLPCVHSVSQTSYTLKLIALPLYKLSTNQLRLITVQNVIHKCLKTEQSTEADSSLDFLDDIKKLIDQVSDVKMATACANWVMQRFPKGKQKVKAAFIAKSYAKQWVEFTKDKESTDAYNKLCSTYRRLATIQLLNDYDLDNAENLNLASRPVKLIMNIFENHEVGQFICNSSIDVYRACEEISVVNECNFNKICMKMLETWLPPPQTVPDNLHDQTIDFQLTMTSVKEPQNEGRKQQEQNIRRAIYLLQQHGDQNEKLMYLVQIAFSDSLNISQVEKYQALRCLMSITDENNMLQLTKKSVPELRLYMESLLCVSQLECLHLPYSPEDFCQTNKAELVEAVLQSHPNKKSALDLVSSLCFHYELYLPHLWDVIFHQMVAFDTQLDDIISHVMNISQLCHCQPFVNALNNLLKSPFNEGRSTNIIRTLNSFSFIKVTAIRECILALLANAHFSKFDEVVKIIQLHQANNNPMLANNLSFPDLPSKIQFIQSFAEQKNIDVELESP